MTESPVIAALDLGTHRVRALVAEYDEDGTLKVSGWGKAPSEGLRRGVVVNIEAAKESVSAALEAAEQQAGRTVTEVWASLGGSTVNGLNSRGVVAVSGKNREIGRLDVERVIEAARAVVIPTDRDILHVLPQEYIIDDQGGVYDPMDMIGVRLEAEVHIITTSVSAVRNLEKAVSRGGYGVREIDLGILAATEATLNEDERDMGVLVVDIGAGSTDYLLMYGGTPRVTGSLPVGGDQVTKDLSIVLKTPIEAAERIKRESGCCWPPLVDTDEPLSIPGVGGRPPMPVSVNEVCAILQPRMEEFFRLIQDRVRRGGMSARMAGGVVLIGGGAVLAGTTELAGRVFETPARIGNPGPETLWPESCRSGEWATAAGLIVLGDSAGNGGGSVDEIPRERNKSLKGLARWLGEFF